MPEPSTLIKNKLRLLGRVGGSRCLCRGCLEVFSSATIFDEHQNDSAPVVCYNPEERGLEKTDGIWHKKESLAPTRRPPPPIRPPHQEAQDGGQDGTQTDAGPAGRP